MPNQQNIEFTDIEAEVYHADFTKRRYFVKVHFVGMGMYINSFSVQPSIREKGLWVSPPTHPQGGKYTTTVDFDKNKPLWRVVEKKSLEAVNVFAAKNPGTSSFIGEGTRKIMF